MKNKIKELSSQNSQNKKQKNNYLSLLLLLLFLFACVVLVLIPRLFTAAAGINYLPVSIHSRREADYSKNNQLEIPLVNIDIVGDILEDLNLPTDEYKDRMATITAEINLPIPTSTGINSVTRTLQPTATATQTVLHSSTSTPKNNPSSPTPRTLTRTPSPTPTGTIFTPRPTQKTPTTDPKTPTTITKTPTTILKTPTTFTNTPTHGLHIGQTKTPKPTNTPKPPKSQEPTLMGDNLEPEKKQPPASSSFRYLIGGFWLSLTYLIISNVHLDRKS
ncbi:MAG: hypothetical protein ABIJ65_02260 [Chloroflexota bacterium]